MWVLKKESRFGCQPHHWGKADDRNCINGHPKMLDEKLGQYLYCLLI